MVFVLFIAIGLWAWSGKNKKAFDEAARIPLEDDLEVTRGDSNSEHKKETSNG